MNGGKEEEDPKGNSLQMKQKHNNYYIEQRNKGDVEDEVKENTLVFKRKVLIILRLETRDAMDKIRDLEQVGSPELDRNSVIPGHRRRRCWSQSYR